MRLATLFIAAWLGKELPLVGNPYRVTKRVYGIIKPLAKPLVPLAKPVVDLGVKVVKPVAKPCFAQGEMDGPCVIV